MSTTVDNAHGFEPQAERDEDEIDLLEYWRILRDRKWLVAAIAGGVFALALVLTLLTTPIFRASSTLQIDRETIKVVDVGGLTPAESPYDEDFYQTQYELLQSRSLALRVIQDLKLADNPQFKDDKPAPTGSAIAAPRVQGRDRALVSTVLGGLTIEPIRNSRLVKINFDSPDPVLAARIANAWGQAFIASNLERRLDATSYARKYLEDRLAQLKGRLEDSEKQLVQFATQEQIVSVGDDKQSLSAQNLTDLNASLAQAQDARIKAESEWAQASAGSGLGMPQVVANPLIQKLRENRTVIAAEYQEKLKTFQPDYPDMQRLQGQMDEIDHQVNNEISNIRASVKAQYDAAQSQETLLTERIGGLKGDVLDLQGRSIQYNILKREANTNRELYDSLLQRYKEIGVAGNVGTNNISVVDMAEVPEFRHSPRLSLNLAVGLLLGMFAGVLAAFLLHYLDRSIRAPQMLESLAQRPVLGVVPRLAAGITPALAAADPRSPFSEAYRSVRTALQFATNHGLPRTVLITSASPGEGKTTSSIELARNIAQVGRSVLLIDADLRNPSVHRLLSLGNAVGLSSILAGSNDVQGAIQSSGEANLSVMTSGPMPPSPPELLAGDALPQLLESLRARFDVIVMDGPPVLGLADAPLLAHCAEATVLCALADSTRRDALQGALRRLVAAQAHVLGTLLVRYDHKHAGYGYGGYSYYAYGPKS
ncbi:GumC family protein [Cognatiluteimonas profundi]|uniref:GumC family protein n=1 Tax=Cognatiluteimonas profundi TaxID=2594501 RepID=UPI00131DAC00|nr:polysaccharide biosynthesis tyrosine autokinase [Lysobacter profundi]